MKKLFMAAALVAAVAPQAFGAESCYTQSAIEAEQAIRYMTDLMVVSSTCSHPAYGQFRARNQDAIVAYQKAMITHFRGAAAFDSWNTVIANQAAMTKAGVPTATVCQQGAQLLQQSASLDPAKFRAYAAAQAAVAAPRYQKCDR